MKKRFFRRVRNRALAGVPESALAIAEQHDQAAQMHRESEILMTVAVEVAHLHIAIVVREWRKPGFSPSRPRTLAVAKKNHRTRSRSLVGRAMYDVGMAIVVHIGDREALAPLT